MDERPARPVVKKIKDTKYRGVYSKGTRWSAEITIEGVKKVIGIYEWEVMAALQYDWEVINSGNSDRTVPLSMSKQIDVCLIVAIR